MSRAPGLPGSDPNMPKAAVSSNYELAAIGDEAMFEVLFGDYEQAMKNMDAKLNEFAERHIWD